MARNRITRGRRGAGLTGADRARGPAAAEVPQGTVEAPPSHERGVAARFKIIASLIAALLIAACTPEAWGEADPGPDPGHQSTVATEASRLGMNNGQSAQAVSDEHPGPAGLDDCPAPQLRPTTLPWTAAGEPVGDPVEVAEGHGGTGLVWRSESSNDGGKGPLLSLDVHPDDGQEPGTGVLRRVSVRGRIGELVWVGDPGVGVLALRWREHDGPCGIYAAHLSTKGLEPISTPAWIPMV